MTEMKTHAEEAPIDSRVVARALNTMITLPVFFELRNYAEGTANSYGKWSYDTAFKLLLVKTKAYDTLHEEIKLLQDRLSKLEMEENQ